MLTLSATTQSLQLVSSSSSALSVVASWGDLTSGGIDLGSNQVAISSATTTEIVAAPGASTDRQVKGITIRNTGAASNTVTVLKDVSGTDYTVTPAVALSPGEALHYHCAQGWRVLDVSGRIKVTASELQGSAGRAMSFLKVGAAMEAAGVLHSHHAASGFPGAWTLGTPGVNGANLSNADGGCIPFTNASSGGVYLTGMTATMTVAGGVWLVDVLWYNTGLTVTTTTAQTFTTPTWPARDVNGSTNGEGVGFGILATATLGNAAITNTTASYTDSDGNAGATATIASVAASLTAGSVVPFQLAAGDKGVGSIQSVTLGTSYVSGSLSIVAFRRIAYIPVPLANTGQQAMFDGNPGVRLFDGSCLHLWQLPTATTATTVQGVLTTAER